MSLFHQLHFISSSAQNFQEDNLLKGAINSINGRLLKISVGTLLPRLNKSLKMSGLFFANPKVTQKLNAVMPAIIFPTIPMLATKRQIKRSATIRPIQVKAISFSVVSK